MRKCSHRFLAIALLGTGFGLGFSGDADAVSFSYSYAGPHYFSARTYIDSVDDALVDSSYNNAQYFYVPTTGTTSSSYMDATPGVITYKFDFGTEIVGSAFLKSNQPAFRQAYSSGYNLLYGSKDGSTWEQLLEVTTPGNPGQTNLANSGFYNQFLPTSLLGGNELWFKVELYVYNCIFNAGQSCNTNTAQHSRWDRFVPNSHLAETFKLDVDYGASTVPIPAALPLFASGLGLLGFIGWRRKRKIAPAD